LFCLPMVFSIISLKNEKNGLSKFILALSTIGFIVTGLLTLYILVLGTAWNH
jgi:uncharacterized membrane protein YqjE